MKFNTFPKKIGGSFYALIPNYVVDEMDIQKGTKLEVEIVEAQVPYENYHCNHCGFNFSSYPGICPECNSIDLEIIKDERRYE